MKYILILLLSINDTSFAQVPSPCDEKIEKKIEKENDICEAQKKKSKKVWGELESAKSTIVKALTDNNADTLKPYIGCDSISLSKYDLFCLSQETKLSSQHLDTLVKKISENKYAVDTLEWTNYGIKKDIYLLCSKKYRTAVSKNFCKNKTFQPIIEIRKSPSGYYIFGAAIADPGP